MYMFGEEEQKELEEKEKYYERRNKHFQGNQTFRATASSWSIQLLGVGRNKLWWRSLAQGAHSCSQ